MSIFCLIAVLLVACQMSSYGQHGKLNDPFKKLQYDRVVAYEYDGEAGVEIIDEHGKLAKFVYTTTQLTAAQIKNINRILTDTATYGGETAACFDPHMGIVYYNKDKVAAYVSVCMACNFLQESKQIPIGAATYYAIEQDGERYPRAGFSKRGRVALRKFTDGLHFKKGFHKAYSPFDE